jgi:small GTP-binding protein
LRRDGTLEGEWDIGSGPGIPAKIEDGLEHSRVLVLCLSAAALAADWPQLESHTFRFKDPLNHNRRFIPLRLDDAPLKGSLAQFLYINWRPNEREQEYPKLLQACRATAKVAAEEEFPEEGAEKVIQLKGDKDFTGFAFDLDGNRALTGSADNTVRLWDLKTEQCLSTLNGHKGWVWSVAWSADQRQALSCSDDNTVRLWDIETGKCIRVLEGHTGAVKEVMWSANQRHALSSSQDNTVRLWDVKTGKCIRILEGHTSGVMAVAWSADQRQALSGSNDNTVRLWDVDTGKCIRILEGHSDTIWSVAWNIDQRLALSGAADNTVRLWNVETGQCISNLKGHESTVYRVAYSANQHYCMTGSWDNSVRIWDMGTGQCIRSLKGHESNVWSVAWSVDGIHGYSADFKGGIRVWDLSKFVTNSQAPKTPTTAHPPLPDQVQYTNAKVLLVGNSAAGKTGLSNRLAQNIFEKTDSTVGAWATQWKLPLETKDGVEREVWLWDFGGQADQRLIHQLYMDQTQVAALVFDPQKQELLDTLGTWDRDLTRAATQDFKKLLVAGRTDAGGLRSVSRGQVETFAKERGFADYLETSAKENVGCDELKTAIIDLIDWDQMTKRTSPALFKRLKEEIVRLKEEGRVLMRFNELREALTLRMSNVSKDETIVTRSVSEGFGSDARTDEESLAHASGYDANRFTDDELKTVISLLAGPGVVWELGFGSWILLQPELINSHAQAVIRSLRDDKRELGCIAETQVLSGDLAFPKQNPRLERGDERIVLLAMHQILVEHGLCLRDEDPEQKSPTMLVFPSYARRERPDLVEYPSVIVSYQFNGFLDDIYATLVVRLHHTQPFERDQLWLDAADFKTMTDRRLGVKLSRRADGAGELEVYFDPEISVQEMMIFSKYVHEHLLKKAKDVVRLRHYVCTHEYKGKPCETDANREVAMERLAEHGQHATINCQRCDETMELWDELERRFADPAVQARVRELEEQSKVTLDTESKERILVGEVISTVAIAGQICRELSVSDHGIDMEIEFKDDEGKATGKKLYLQLKFGDSYLRRLKSGKEKFDIKKSRHAEYWADQAFPVMLVIMNSRWEFKKREWRQLDGTEIRWMEIREYLQANPGAKSIEFAGGRFDVMSIRRWRETALPPE